MMVDGAIFGDETMDKLANEGIAPLVGDFAPQFCNAPGGECSSRIVPEPREKIEKLSIVRR